jgi:hypothetical protein
MFRALWRLLVLCQTSKPGTLDVRVTVSKRTRKKTASDHFTYT